MQSAFVDEIPVAPIHGQCWRSDVSQETSWSAAFNPVALARHDDDDLVAKSGRSPKLRFDVSPNAATARRIKGADVDDPHRTA